MAKRAEKLKALRLRRGGRSIGSIARELGVSKGSVSAWCEDIHLTEAQKENIRRLRIAAGHKGRLLGAEMNRQKRLTQISDYEKAGKAEIKYLSRRDMLILGLGLYWGEGVKARSSGTAMINSDPNIILFTMSWFKVCLGVRKKDFVPYIFISEHHRSRARKVLRYWSSLLGLPRSQFGKMVFLKGRPKKIYENHNSYYGICALRVRKGTSLKYRILGLIEACKENAGVAQLVRALHS